MFYIVLYAFLAGFFSTLLFVFYKTLEDGRPKWTQHESLIGNNPGECSRSILDPANPQDRPHWHIHRHQFHFPSPPPSLADFSMDLNHSGLFVSVFCMQMKAWVTDPCTSKMTSSSSNSTQTTRSMSTCGGNKSTTSSNVRHMATWATSVSVSVSVSVSQVSVCNHGNIVIDLNSVPGAERDRTVQLHRQARR